MGNELATFGMIFFSLVLGICGFNKILEGYRKMRSGRIAR
jgi:hypothetical protein